MKKQITAIIVALFCSSVQAKITHLLPTPKMVTENNGYFSLGKKIKISDTSNNTLLRTFAEENGGITQSADAPQITTEIAATIAGAYDYPLHGYPNEAYYLKIEPRKITIKAVTPTGITRAAQTLTQLAEGYTSSPALECVEITDWPSFKLRGFMHDVGRSFIPIEEIKKEIELLSRFKINTFHFHLTENQAWRFEVKKYPQLTAP